MKNTVKMVASENLLQSVIISQNADMMNGIRELIQNGIDSYYLTNRRAVIEIQVPDAYTLIYRDWGKSLGSSKEEVISNFFVFGNSCKSAEQLGKFGIGRGQIMAMIYDCDNKKLNGTHTISSGKFIIKDIDILNLEAQIIENDSYVDGMEWVMKSDKPIFKADEIEDYLAEKILSAIEISFNGNVVSKQIENCVKYSTTNFDLFINDKDTTSNYIEVFERGIYCTSKFFVAGFSGYLITKIPLEMNFARNEIVANSVWNDIIKELKMCIYKYAQRDKTKLTDNRKKGLLSLLVDNYEQMPYLENLKIVDLANGKVTRFTDIAVAKTLYRGEKDSRVADTAIEAGFYVVENTSPLYYGGHELLEKYAIERKDLENSAHGLKFKSSTYSEVDNYAMTEYEKRITTLLGKLYPGEKNSRYQRRAIKVGIAESVFSAWTDGATIWINKPIFDKLSLLENDAAGMPMYIQYLAHEYAHYYDDRVNDVHNYSFYETAHNCQRFLVDSYLTLLRD